jgi:hypothetical protein
VTPRELALQHQGMLPDSQNPAAIAYAIHGLRNLQRRGLFSGRITGDPTALYRAISAAVYAGKPILTSSIAPDGAASYTQPVPPQRQLFDTPEQYAHVTTAAEHAHDNALAAVLTAALAKAHRLPLHPQEQQLPANIFAARGTPYAGGI